MNRKLLVFFRGSPYRVNRFSDIYRLHAKTVIAAINSGESESTNPSGDPERTKQSNNSLSHATSGTNQSTRNNRTNGDR